MTPKPSDNTENRRFASTAAELWAAALAECRVVDLSKKIEPGKVFGPAGLGSRKYELKPFTFPPGEIMTEILMENHISTHVECPAHFLEPRHGRKGLDVSEMPLSAFFGPALFINLAESKPGQEITPEWVEQSGARPGDIVLFGNATHDGPNRPFLGAEVARYLAELPARMVGIDDSVYPENPKFLLKELNEYHIHDQLLSHDIPLIEGLANLRELPEGCFVFFGAPAAMGGCDSFPVRAFALV